MNKLEQIEENEVPKANYEAFVSVDEIKLEELVNKYSYKLSTDYDDMDEYRHCLLKLSIDGHSVFIILFRYLSWDKGFNILIDKEYKNKKLALMLALDMLEIDHKLLTWQ
jgi:hypothetical protein